jgi:hypothetical protein
MSARPRESYLRAANSAHAVPARVIATPPDFRRFDAQDARPLFG